MALSMVTMQSLNTPKNVTEKCQTLAGGRQRMGREERWGWVLCREGPEGKVKGSMLRPMV